MRHRLLSSNKTAASSRTCLCGYREGAKPGGGRRREDLKMKKSLMPCERRDLSSVTPDEPAEDDEERGNARPQATYIHSQFAEKGIAHNRHADCADRSTDVYTYLVRELVFSWLRTGGRIADWFDAANEICHGNLVFDVSATIWSIYLWHNGTIWLHWSTERNAWS